MRNVEPEGKGAGVSGGVPLARGLRGWNPLAGLRGSAPRTLPRALLARGIQQLPVARIIAGIPTALTSSWPQRPGCAKDDSAPA